jgi:hypothetical protein
MQSEGCIDPSVAPSYHNPFKCLPLLQKGFVATSPFFVGVQMVPKRAAPTNALIYWGGSIFSRPYKLDLLSRPPTNRRQIVKIKH